MSVLVRLVRCSRGVLLGYWGCWVGFCGVVLAWLRDVFGLVGEHEAVMLMTGSASRLYRS